MLDIEPNDTFTRIDTTMYQVRGSKERTIGILKWFGREESPNEVPVPRENALAAFDALGIAYKLVTPDPEYPRVPFPTHALRDNTKGQWRSMGTLEDMKNQKSICVGWEDYEIVAIDLPKP